MTDAIKRKTIETIKTQPYIDNGLSGAGLSTMEVVAWMMIPEYKGE